MSCIKEVWKFAKIAVGNQIWNRKIANLAESLKFPFNFVFKA